ncbi:Hypothetical protein CINCED_3A013561 [Cinara cedri]|uniref:Carboxylic ester hydrolase n=1 Tax=Cinara cedri TaxID=506608 RepID=A0A5E4N9Z6_9HEMI|nr:Hypothetical protein CINCED_3A013561 [Cinara cedri]
METFIIFTLFFGFVVSTDNILLQLNQGWIRGGSMVSRNGRDFKAFQGIPYAKPPIGDLRLKDPEPLISWDVDILNATSEPKFCIQKNYISYIPDSKVSGHEDCLYLNVYTPKIPKEEDTEFLPVMVWIHGGGYFAWHGGSSFFDPQYLLDKNIIFVSMNYRLGILGFLSTEDDNLPGNYGMKDQVLALQWIQSNIERFGGDRQKVTIFGGSAGAGSVGLHLLSPMSKGLFHKAIMQSGTPLCPWAVSPPGWARRRALSLSTIAGCPSDPKLLAECLRKIPADLLVDLQFNFFVITFNPVVENCENKKGFLCHYPLLDFKQESNVPILMGLNTAEGGLIASRMYDESCKFSKLQLKNNFHNLISSILMYKYTSKMSDIPIIGDKILEHYFPSRNIDDPMKLVDMISGGFFFQCSINMATSLTSPVRFYVYGHKNEFTFNTIFGPCNKSLGVSHCDDLISLFALPVAKKLKEEDLKVSELMVNLWTRFASAKIITVDGKENGNEWPLFDAKKQSFLLINSSNPVITEKLYMDEYMFWNDLPLLSAFKGSKNVLKTEF